MKVWNNGFDQLLIIWRRKKAFLISIWTQNLAYKNRFTILKEQITGQFHYLVLSPLHLNLYLLHFFQSSYCFFLSVLFLYHLILLILVISFPCLTTAVCQWSTATLPHPWKYSLPENNKRVNNALKQYSQNHRPLIFAGFFHFWDLWVLFRRKCLSPPPLVEEKNNN